jgi:AraC-like DNA-binding protein
VSLIKKIESNEINNLSIFLSKHFDKSYAVLSKLFSKKEGITIEKYLINLKIERVKELIQLGQLNFSEIAYTLNYSNSGHLSRQFKTVTGMSMSSYRSLQNWDRKTLDQII